jgi:hypothetical protein
MFASELKGFEAELPSAGHDPAAHVLQRPVLFKKTWVAGSSPATGVRVGHFWAFLASNIANSRGPNPAMT